MSDSNRFVPTDASVRSVQTGRRVPLVTIYDWAITGGIPTQYVGIYAYLNYLVDTDQTSDVSPASIGEALDVSEEFVDAAFAAMQEALLLVKHPDGHVLSNLAMDLRTKGVPEDEVRRRVAAAVEGGDL